MAASPTEEVTGDTSVTNCNDNAEHEVDESLDDFLRDTNDLVTNSNKDASNSPDSSGDGEGRSMSISGGVAGWVMRQFRAGVDPRRLLETVLLPGTTLPPDLDEVTLWSIVLRCMAEPEPRSKLSHVNTLDDVVSLLKSSSKIIVLTGAGISVSCGIPDFRSANGVYARLAVEYPDLPDPQSMFDIYYFKDNPKPFFSFAKEIYPGQFQPSPSHYFISELEKRDKLLRNFTQNIDTLEQAAGITRMIQCHGSFATATCMNCKYQVTAEDIKEDVFNQVVPQCPKCAGQIPPQSNNEDDDDNQEEVLTVMKPDIVFFGEGLPDVFHHTLDQDKLSADLLLVIGSSLKVRPVALVPSILDESIPQVLINREPLKNMTFDVELLGDCDVVISELCSRLGSDWLEGIGMSSTHKPAEFTHAPPSRYLFPGSVVDSSTLDTSDTSSSSDGVPSSSTNPNREESSSCNNTGQPEPDTGGFDGAPLDSTTPQQQQQKTDMSNDSLPPSSHETTLADTTDHNNDATKHDTNKNVHEPPQLCEPPSKRPNLELV